MNSGTQSKMKMYQIIVFCSLVMMGMVSGKKIYKQLQDKSVIKSALMLGGGAALSSQSWGQIDQTFLHLEQRVALLEEIYHNEISDGLEEIQIMQSSIYPIFGVFILASMIGIIILFKKVNKDDLVSFLSRAAKIPDYLHRIRSSNVFSNNQNAPPTAPYLSHSLHNHPEILSHRTNPYFNGYSESMMNPAGGRNNAQVEQPS